MHTLIPLKFKMTVIVFLVVALFLALSLLYQHVTDAPSLVTFKSFSTVAGWEVTILTLLSLALSVERIWQKLLNPKFLRLLGQPPILGEWQGSINSNYSRLSALRDAAKSSDEARIDADSADFIDSVPLLSRPATLTIVGSLWHIKVILRTGPAQDRHLGLESRSVVAKLVKDPDGAISIWYLYDAVGHGEPTGNDQKTHRGAAVLRIDANGVAEGEYWNARNWRKGMNAAGTLNFSLA